ncbi:MAG: hypothetical protein ABUL47_07500 [Leifsonia sp.]
MSEPTLPDTSSDERAVGWGDEHDDPAYGEDGAEDERLIAERPPHHDRTD